MQDLVGSPVLLGVCLAAVVVASMSWIATMLHLFTPRTRARVRIVAVVAIAAAILIIATRFVVLGA